MQLKKVFSENRIKIVSAAAALFAVLPILYTCVRCNFMSDDFCDLVEFRKFGENIFAAAFSYTGYIYNNWLGTYFSKFLVPFSPLNLGNVTGLRVMMTLCAVVFLAAFFLFLKAVADYLQWESNVPYMLFGLLTFTLFFCNAYPEVFYWFSGGVAYLLPIELGLLGIAGMIYGEAKFRKGVLILSCIGVFCMSGGALQGAGLGCYLILLLLAHHAVSEKKISLYYGIVFGVAVAGALINTMAPGNYIRHAEVDDTGLHFVSMLFGTVKIVGKQIAGFCGNPVFLIFLITAFFIGAKCLRPYAYGAGRWLITAAAVLLIPVVCAYPVVLAYSAPGIEYFANRNLFLLDFSILLSLCGVMLLAGMWMQRYQSFRADATTMVLAGMLSAVILLQNLFLLPEQAGVYMWREVLSGEIKVHYSLIEAMYEKIENSPEEDVYISQSELTLVPDGCYYNAVTMDETSWTNEAIAEFYGKKTVRLTE